MKTKPDKKFRRILRAHERLCTATNYHERGMHLVQRKERGKRMVVAVRNAVRQAPYLPASPKVDGVRMRWEKGKLVPRVRA